MGIFTIEHPNEYTWIARKDSSSGYIVSAMGKAAAIASPLAMLSKVTQGIKDSDATAFLKEGNAQLFIESVCISYLRRIQRECDETERSSLGLRIRAFIKAGTLKETLDDKTIDTFLEKDFFEKVVEYALKEGFRAVGYRGVEIIGSRIKKIETGIKSDTLEENEFLSCVSRRATELGEVPTQKDVYDLWYDDHLRRSRDKFDGIRDRLGFSWLPQGKPGRKSHS